MSQPARIQVLMPCEEAMRFDAFCRERGHKKSTLIVRLVREHLEREGNHAPRDRLAKESHS